MATIVESKMIIIKNRGLITTGRGKLTTPITRPYRETCGNIWNMLTREKADVYEVFPDGTELQLSAHNFNTSNVDYIKYLKSQDPTASSFSAPSGKSITYQNPQSAAEKASETFKGQSVFTHDTKPFVEPPMKPTAADEQKSSPQEMWNRGGKKNKGGKHNPHGNQTLNSGKVESEQPVKDLTVGMETV